VGIWMQALKAISRRLKRAKDWISLSWSVTQPEKSELSEIKSMIAHLTNLLNTTRSELNNLSNHLDTSIHTRLNTIEFELIDRLFDQMHELAAVQFESRAKVGSDQSQWRPHPAERYGPADPKSFFEYLTAAHREFPRVFSLWKERLGATQAAFAQTKVGNTAHVADPRSRLFRSLVELYASGRVLDVGCGVFGRPYYLLSYPAELISGVDPLIPIEAPDFEHIQGISEYLPWPDQSFSTVISATSLDHSMSLDRSLNEMRRVLRPGGRQLLWIDSVPGSIEYKPNDSGFRPADRYHLFHFDVAWFEPMISQLFQIVDRMELHRREFNRVMYVLAKNIS